VDLHSKFGFALAAFVMSFIGIPFSVFNNRTGGRMLSVGMCLGLAFGYWSLLSVGMTMGRHGYLSPILSAWLPNLFMLGLSTFFLLRLKK
jgi:lipopolysaccharide export LptBFGC system permease protein LptF